MTDSGNAGRRLPVLEVFIYRAGVFCGTECFAQEEILIGRDPRMDLPLVDEMISRAHAVLCVENDRLIIQDLDSSNGIKVNDQPVLHSDLGSLDQVALGSFVLRFHLYSSPACGAREKALAPVVKLDSTTDKTVEKTGLEMVDTEDCVYQLVGMPDDEETYKDFSGPSWTTKISAAPSKRRRTDTTKVEDEDYLRLLAS
jgi:hypothetical protein